MALKPLSAKEIGDALEELREWTFEFKLGRKLLIRQIDFRDLGFMSESVLSKFLSQRVLPLAVQLKQYIAFNFVTKGVLRIEITTAELSYHLTAKDIRFAKKLEEIIARLPVLRKK